MERYSLFKELIQLLHTVLSVKTCWQLCFIDWQRSLDFFSAHITYKDAYIYVRVCKCVSVRVHRMPMYAYNTSQTIIYSMHRNELFNAKSSHLILILSVYSCNIFIVFPELYHLSYLTITHLRLLQVYNWKVYTRKFSSCICVCEKLVRTLFRVSMQKHYRRILDN